MDILHSQPFASLMLHLGYPPYFSVMVGIWKVLGAAAVLVPTFPRLKEWAYAGMFFNMTGAVGSHLAIQDSPAKLISPLIFTALVVASWTLCPSSRRVVLGA
jgi:hypothetical protein